jgi:hypothetical protein
MPDTLPPDLVVLAEEIRDGLRYVLAVRRVDPASLDVPNAGYTQLEPKVYVTPR